MSADNSIRDILAKFGENFDDKGTVWRVQGTPVISHKALERIAAKAGVKYDAPTIIRAERDEAVILVIGRLGDRMEWSIGEALVNVNYRVSGKQAGYVWAMSEKRAKDRVILKLVSLHGLAYSEEEADSFSAPSAGAQPGPTARDEYVAACRRRISTATDGPALRDWWQSQDERDARRDFELTQDEVDSLKTALGDRLQTLGRKEAA